MKLLQALGTLCIYFLVGGGDFLFIIALQRDKSHSGRTSQLLLPSGSLDKRKWTISRAGDSCVKTSAKPQSHEHCPFTNEQFKTDLFS